MKDSELNYSGWFTVFNGVQSSLFHLTMYPHSLVPILLVSDQLPCKNKIIIFYLFDTKKTFANLELSKQFEFSHGDILQNTERRKPRI